MESLYLSAGLFGVGLALWMMEPPSTMGADGQRKASKRGTGEFLGGPSSLAYAKPEDIESEEDGVDPINGRAYHKVTLKAGTVCYRYKDINGNDPTK